MKKKIVSTIALGIVATQFTPYIANAMPNTESTQKEMINKQEEIKINTKTNNKYPNLINPNKNDMKPVEFSEKTNLELNEIIKILDELDNEFNKDKLMEVFDRIFELNINLTMDEVESHKGYDQIDYIIFKATYHGFINTIDNERDELFITIADNMYLSAAKRFNKGEYSRLLRKYGEYYGNMLRPYFPNERTQEILANLRSMLMFIAKSEHSVPDLIDPNAKPPKFPEDEKPSTIKPDTTPEDEENLKPPTSPEIPNLPPVENDVVKPDEKPVAKGNVIYQTHVQDYGWQDWNSNGEMSGTSGQGKRLEGIRIKISDMIPGASIKYRTHIQDYGWQDWKADGELSGTEGKGKRLEGVEIKLENAPGYSVEYRTHVQDYGWQDWKRNGEMSGTSGKAKRLEGIEIRIVKDDSAKVEYRTHIQDYGWQDWKNNGQMSGTEGQAKRLEGIEIKATNLPKGASIEYRTHVQDYGWQEWKRNGEMSGTSGKAKRLEGIEIKLENAPGYSVEYRTHVQDYGWQDWKRNGEMSGTEGQAKRLEGIEIRIVKNK